MSIFNIHTSKARYELKVVGFSTFGAYINVKTIPGFIHITLADFFTDILAP